MDTISINVKFRIKQEVYRKSDTDKNRHIVVGYTVDIQGIMYQVRGENGLYTLYDFEIDLYENRLAIIN